MKKLIILFLISFAISYANDINRYQNIHPKTRSFKSIKEFKTHKHQKHIHPDTLKNAKYYQHRYEHFHITNHHTSYTSHHTYRPKPQRGYRHPKKSWFYAYRYTKADFVDRYGFYYGYFDRRGYMFEGEFYRYDRDYRYQDRLRGRGLFDRHYFYRPLPRIYRDDLYR